MDRRIEALLRENREQAEEIIKLRKQIDALLKQVDELEEDLEDLSSSRNDERERSDD